MPYTPEEDYKMRSMAYGYGPQEGVPSGKSQGSTGVQKQRKDNSSEGAFSPESNYGKNPNADYYQQEMYNSFNQQYYPMMGQHYPQPPPQQPQQSSQQSQQPSQGSRNF